MVRLRIPTLILLTAAVCGSGLLSATTPAETRIRLQKSEADGGLQLEVSGEWQSGCPPLLDRIEVDGGNVRVFGKPDSQRCDGSPGPYALQADLPRELRQTAAGVLRLSYLLQDDPLSPPRLLAFELVQPGDAGTAELEFVEPESGFWWGEVGADFDHAGPGLSAQIERQGSMIALSFTGYDDEGSPDWTFGAAALRGRLTDIALSRLGEGRGPFGGYVGPTRAEIAGRLQIEWLTASRATFWFSRAEADGRQLELRPMSMVRFEFGTRPGTDWVGRWLLEAGDRLSATAFEMVRRRPDGFDMRGSLGEQLSCDIAADRPSSPPRQCSLEFTDGDLWYLHDIGLTHLYGRDQRGTRVRLNLLDD